MVSPEWFAEITTHTEVQWAHRHILFLGKVKLLWLLSNKLILIMIATEILSYRQNDTLSALVNNLPKLTRPEPIHPCCWYKKLIIDTEGVCYTTVLWLNHGPLARYVKSRVAHAAGMPGTFSPPPRLAIPTCITARAWRTCRDACRDC